MPKCLFAALPLAFVAFNLFAGEVPECYRDFEISARYYSPDVVLENGNCSVKSHIVFQNAQSQMLAMCRSWRGQYRASAQTPVCGNPFKVAEPAEGYVEVAGVCSIEGMSSCRQQGDALFLGVLRD